MSLQSLSLFGTEGESAQVKTTVAHGMRLVRLTSNQASFKTVEFNLSGVSLIVARQQNPDRSELDKTYNGVGKSLLVAIIHYCLGAEHNPEWEEKLPEWEWTLDFDLPQGRYSSTRSTSQKNVIFLNNKEYSLDRFKRHLEGIVMGLEEKVPYLTFRPYIKRFIRPNRYAYVDYLKAEKKENDYDALLVNSYLLGLDLGLVQRKQELKQQKDSSTKQLKGLTKDPTYREFYGSPETVDLQIRYIENQIENLQKSLDQFEVAENYREIEEEANNVKSQLREAKNRLFVARNTWERLGKSMREKPDISIEKVRTLYKEAEVALPEAVTARIDAVLEFHQQLMSNRKIRAERERSVQHAIIEQVEDEVRNLGEKQNNLLKYLNTHRALDEYVALSQRIGELQAQKDGLSKSKSFFESKNKDIRKIEREKLEEDEKSETYISELQSTLSGIDARFESLVKRFYPDKPCGLSITPDTGDSGLRFKINAFIQDQLSEGINHIKIFCYDMTILQVRPLPGVDFVWHDSRIFGGVDPRQSSILLDLAMEYTSQNGKQYIVSINQDMIDRIEKVWGREKVVNFVEKHRVLELTDESPEFKLLGKQVDLMYEP